MAFEFWKVDYDENFHCSLVSRVCFRNFRNGWEYRNFILWLVTSILRYYYLSMWLWRSKLTDKLLCILQTFAFFWLRFAFTWSHFTKYLYYVCLAQYMVWNLWKHKLYLRKKNKLYQLRNWHFFLHNRVSKYRKTVHYSVRALVLNFEVIYASSIVILCQNILVLRII